MGQFEPTNRELSHKGSYGWYLATSLYMKKDIIMRDKNHHS